MSKFFKSLLLLLSAGLFTATGWAADPIAMWSNFSTTASGGYSFVSNSNTLTDGVMQMTGRPARLESSLSWNPRDTTNSTGLVVAMTISELATTNANQTLIAVKSSQGDNRFGLTLNSDGNFYAIYAGSPRTSNNGASSKACPQDSNQNKYIVVFKYTNYGTQAWILDITQEDTSKVKCVDDSGYKDGGTVGTMICLGASYGPANPATGMKIHNVAIWNKDISEDTAFEMIKELGEPVNASRTISGEVYWEDGATWDPSMPTIGSSATLTVAGDAKLTMDKSVTLQNLSIVEDEDAETQDKLTIAKTDSNKLSALITTINADTTVEAGAASLGAVTVAGEKTLTVKEAPTNVYTSLSNNGALCLDGGDATTPLTIVNNNALGKILLADGAVVKMTATGGNKIYNIEGVADAEVKPELRLHSGQNWGVTIPGSAFKNVKLVLPEKNSNDGSGTYSFWLTPSTLANDASVDLEIKGGQGLTFENVNSVTAVFGSFVTNGAFSGTTVQTGTGEISGNGGTTNITVTNSGEGSFTVARAYGSSLTIGENGRVTVDEGGSLTGAVSVTGALTYATNATATNTITNNGTITADTATVDLTGATISGTGTYAVTNGATLILDAGTENGASVTNGTLKLLLSPAQLINGYTANVAGGTVVTFIKAGAEGYETVAVGVTQYELPAKDGEELSATVGTGDGQVTAWTGVGEDGFVYKNTNLTIHFTANGQTFTFDNTLGVALTSLTVTAEEGVTGCTIALPATEGLVIATASTINTDVTATGKGKLGAVTVADGKTVDVKTFAFTSLAKGEGEGNTVVILDATDAAISHATAFTVPAGITLQTKGAVTLSGDNTIASGAKLEVLSGTTSLGGAEQGLKGNISIAKDATLVNTRTTDALAYGGTLTVDVYGTLSMGDTRWTMGGNNTLNVYSGATITGNGQGTNGALDWYQAGTFNIKKSNADSTNAVTLSANLRTRDDGNIKFVIEEEMTATVSGVIYGNQAVTVNGAGTLTYAVAQTSHSGTLTVESGTLRLDVNHNNINDNNVVFSEGRLVTVNAGGILELKRGYGYFKIEGAGVTKVVDSDFYFGISGNGTNNITTALEVDTDKTFWIRNWGGTGYKLTPTSLTLNGDLKRDTAKGGTFTVETSSLKGKGVIEEMALTLTDNAVIDVTGATAVTATGTVTLPSALTVKITEAQNVAGSVTLLNAAEVTIPAGMAVTVMVGETAGKKLYTVTHDADADIVKLTVAERPVMDAVTAEVPAGGTLTLAGALGDAVFADEGATLIIDFGSEGGEAGTFTFNNKDAIMLTSITVQGTNGGTIVMADGAEIAYGTLVLNTTVAADAAFYATNTGAIDGSGKLCLASGELTLDEANSYTGGTDIAAGATLIMGNANAIGTTGTITGAGKLVCDGVLPTNKSGLTTGTPADGETPASGWLGTVKLQNGNSYDNLDLAPYQNANSVLEIEAVTCYLSCWNGGTMTISNLCLTGEGLQFDNGTSTSGCTLNIATLSGDGKFKGVSGSTQFGYKLFVTDASDFTGELDLSTTGSGRTSVVIGSATTNYNGTIVIAAPVTLDTGKTWKAVNGITVTATGTIAGTGTIGSALTLDTDATIDLTDGAFSTTGTVNLPSELTVKLAAAPTVGTVMPVMKTTAFSDSVGAIEDTTVTVMVNGVEDTTNTYCLQGSSTALLLDNVPAEDVTIDASNIGAAALYASNQMGNYDSHGVQVDLDGPTPYAPGWVKGAYYPLTAFSVVSDTDGSVAAGTCVQVVATDDPTVVVATSAPFQNENKEDVTVTSSNGTNTYKRYTFKFETPVYVDAAKTYQFRFVNGEGAAVTCKLRALYTSDANGGGDNQRYCNWLNNQYEVIDVANVPPRYMPYVVLTAERIVDNSPILRGGDATLEVTPVPEKIRLDTKTFGYGTHTVLQYTGGTTDWSTMDVEGLPEGAEIIKTETTWGFAIKTLNVLTVGDSITAGLVTYYNSSANWHVPGGYRLPLYKRLTRAGYTVKYLGTSDVFGTSTSGIQNPEEANPSPSLGENVHHEGHSGARLNQMITRFSTASVKAVIAEQGVPDVITLHLGTNDFGMDGDTVDNAFAEMKRLIYMLNGSGEATGDKPLYPNATIFVAKIMPRADDGLMTNKIGPFNEKLATYVTSLASDKLVLVDLGMANNYGLLRHDGLHPSTEGYAQMAKEWFEAIDAKFDPFGEATAAPTPVASTPTTDVTESDRAGNSKTKGVLKAAEWTTFTGFATTFTSQFGYMQDSERPWQLDVRGTNVPTVSDGVLSLNGAPITVNPVDGRLGTTISTYTIVMKVSDLAANDVIFTDSAVQCTDWPSAKGTTNADLGKLTVVDADTLQWTYNGLADGPTIDLADVNLTDSTPDVIAITVTCNQCKVAVNGGTAVTVSQGSASETYRGSWSIGAMSTADTGSSMKLYRLSFYEGDATVVMPSEITTATINVGEGDGQYITWKTAKEALKLSDEMESLTLNFTAADQTFTFDNADAVTIDSVTVQGTAGGTIANAGTATVTATNLAINTNVTMNKCYIVDKYTLPIETTTNIAVAQNSVLTYYINGAMSTVTVAATHSGAGKIVKTSWGTLEITKTCDVNVDVNAGQFKVNVPISGETKAIGNEKVVTLTSATLELASGLSYATINGDASSIIRVIGDYTFGISSSFTNDLDAGEIQIEAGKTLTIRNYKSGYVLSPSKLLRVNGTLQRDASNGQDFKVQISDTATLEGSGSITQAIELADGATVHCTATALAVNTVTFAEGTLNVTGADALAEGETVTLFRTTAYAAATGLVEGVVARRVATADETNYRLYKTADAIEVWPSATDAETWTVDAATATTWADVVNQMAAANKRPVDTTALTINFGDKPQDGDAVPGTFSFGEGDVTLGSLTVTGSNGGTITTTGTVMVSTSAAINTAVAVTGQIQLNGATIAADAELAITNYAVLGTQVSGAGALKITGATLSRGLDADIVSDTWTGTVILEDVDDNNLDLRYLVNDSITSTEGVLTVTASSSITIEGTVKAYIYDGAIKTLTLNGDFQMVNGTTNKSYTQCVTVDNLAGAGAFIGHQSSEVCIAVNVKSWTNFTGSIDLSNEKSKNTIFFFGTAPERFTTSITPGNVGAGDSDFTDADYGTIYVTEGDLVTAVGSTWKAPKVNIANGTSLTIQGWFGASESITGLSANTIVGGVKNNEDEVVKAGVLDLRALNDLSGVNVTVKAGGRLLVNTGATVPDTIVFEAGSILGVATKHVEDVGNATLTVNVDGTAATTATIKGYHMDGVTELDNWAKNNETSSEGVFKFNFDPVFDGELCWWAYEFDNEVNTSAESNLGPISTGRDKTRMNFDGRGDSNRVCQDNEYLDHGDGTKAIRVASSPWRNVDGGYPTAFTAAMYGTLTENRNRIIMGFGSSYNQKYTIALVTGASTDEVRLVLQKGWNENNQDYPEDAVITLATTTVPNAVTENHLFAFSYEQFDSEDDDEELDSTRIIFYVDGEKYQPFTAKAIIPLGNGFQMGSIHGGWHNSLTRMNGDDIDCTMEYLRIYDQILPESVWTAMSNEYSYMSKNGRATRTIVAGQDTTWNEGTEWTQIRAVKNGEDYVLDAEGHVTFDSGTAVEKPDHGENVGTQVVLNVSGENTLYLNEFYSNPIQIQNGEVSKLYYERLEINPVEGGDEDSLTLWAGRLNPAIEEEDPLKNSQSAVITVQGYTKINTNVTMAHNVAFLSGPVAVAEGKWLHFDFSGFDVMKVPSMPVTYRLTGFLDEDTRTRVTSTAPADPVNARSIDLGYKTTVNQYTFTVNRYPVRALFTANDEDAGIMGAKTNDPVIDFTNLYYIWQGNDLGKQMNWEAEAVDPQGNPIVENTLAKFVSLDAETQKEKMVTVTLATNDADPITLTLNEDALTKETTPAGTDGEGNPTEAVVENMLGEQQLIVGNNVIVNYTGAAAKLAAALNEVSAETTGVIRTAGFTVDAWRANLSVTGGALAGVGKISGKVTFEEGVTLDASAATVGSCLSAKDADLTNLKAITVDFESVEAAGTTGLKVLSLPVGNTAQTLTDCVVTAVKDDASTVEWTESGDDPTLVVRREDGIYVVGRPDVVCDKNQEVDNNSLTLPLARYAAELGALKLKLTEVHNLAGQKVEGVSVGDAAAVFTGIDFDRGGLQTIEGEEVATAALKYDFGVSQINVVTIGGTEYVVAELIVSNNKDLDQNSAAYADGTTIDVTVKVGNAAQNVTVEAAADMTGATVAPAAELPASTRYVRFPMPDGNGTFEIKARASKAAPAQQ